ncbi:hypothetical protein AB8U03_15535 [Clostridium sp. Mt-5]|uniref:Uncharacterized protein n=1 Tax=Clostridium moutaii TaxID=3240932 RepID=A0ABV4BS21_9CLOT
MFKKINETENLGNEEQRIKYQINRAKEYLEKHKSRNGSENSLECCIISDLLRIIENK